MNYWQSLSLVLISLAGASVAYLTKNFVFEPLLRFRETLGKIRNRLKYFSNIITSPPGLIAIKDDVDYASEASVACRELSCELEERYFAIPFNKQLVRLKVIQPEKNIYDAARSLIFLSNSTHTGEPLENDKKLQEISSNLWFGNRI